MEKFFIITDECNYKKDYIDYKKNIKEVNKFVSEFFEENKIETRQYYVTNEQLYIIPNENDIEKFDKFLNKPMQQGLRGFKKNSKINKLFIQRLKDKNLKVLRRPSLWMYMDGFYGNIKTTTYLLENTVYLKLSTPYDREVNEKGFKEIKGSEYYKAIENEKINFIRL